MVTVWPLPVRGACRVGSCHEAKLGLLAVVIGAGTSWMMSVNSALQCTTQPLQAGVAQQQHSFIVREHTRHMPDTESHNRCSCTWFCTHGYDMRN